MCTTTLELKKYESLCLSTTPPVQLAYTQHERAEELLHLSKQRVQAKRASYEHMRLVSCA
jgi:hypothetical protein